MSYTNLLARATYNYNPHRSNTQKTAIAVGLFCGVLILVISITGLICRSNRSNRSTSYDPESVVSRSQQRREDGGWWGAAPPPNETAAERRRRNPQVRASGGAESGTEREARRESEAREGEAAPPMYQLPAPAYCATPELRRQYLGGRRQGPLPPLPQENDAPPAYDSTPVWPARA